jgi:hypothetical protein
MHHLHNEILRNLENDRVAREVELHFQRLRDAGIEPGTSRKPMLSWLHRDHRGLKSAPARHDVRPTNRPRPA